MSPLSLDRYRLLGASGLRISPLTLGAMTFGNGQGWGATDEEAARIVDRYVERGGNFIDTANFYGSGGSESLLGRLLTGRRDRIVISTKYSLTMRPGDPNASGNQRKNMVRAVEDSLKRLNTDYIDLLYLHMWDGVTPVEEIARAFDDLVRQGKILYAGLSDLPAWQAARLQEITRLRGWTPFAALQIPYSLAERTVERDLIPMAHEMRMGVQPWSPLAGGVLTGKYTAKDLEAESGNPSDAAPRKAMNLSTGRLNARTLDVASVVQAVARELGRTPAQVALAWTLVNPAIVSPVLGVRTCAQLDDNLAALDVAFDTDQLARLDEASQVDLGFPHELLASPARSMMFGGVELDMRR